LAEQKINLTPLDLLLSASISRIWIKYAETDDPRDFFRRDNNIFTLIFNRTVTYIFANCIQEWVSQNIQRLLISASRQIYSAAARVAGCQSDKLKSNSSSTMWRGKWMKRSKVDGSPPTRSIIAALSRFAEIANTCTARATKTTHAGVQNKNLRASISRCALETKVLLLTWRVMIRQLLSSWTKQRTKEQQLAPRWKEREFLRAAEITFYVVNTQEMNFLWCLAEGWLLSLLMD
jgi:hypothetical protein